MLKYILKRILIFIPTLIAISVLTFIISINAPGDPVANILNKSHGGGAQSTKHLADNRAYLSLRHKLGLDLPLFYVSITNATEPDTLYKIPNADIRDNLEHLSFDYGSWPNVAHYYSMIRHLENALLMTPKTKENSEDLNKAVNFASSLMSINDPARIKTIFANLNFIFDNNNSSLEPQKGILNATQAAFDKMVAKQNPYEKYIPVIYYYGLNNQYHHWLVNFLHGNFGISYQDMRPVSDVIWDAMKWTMGLSIVSMLIAYLIAIPLGVKTAVNKGSLSEKTTTSVLYALYSLPNFWIATILIIFLCGGDWLSWFPAPGAPPVPSDAPLIYHLTEGAYRLILPLFCWTYASLAFISRQMRGGMLDVLGQDYIRTARAKGLDEKTVVWKHAVRNSLLPIITIFANVFPLAISGSFIIESIFSIPGMGKVTLEAFFAQNYPVIFTVMMFSAILTVTGILVADILYAVVDPRISFSKKVN